MPPLTPQRVRFSIAQKAEIIEVEDSKRPGFDKRKVEAKYGISRTCLLNILKNKSVTLKAVDFGSKNDKLKSIKNHHYQIWKKNCMSGFVKTLGKVLQ